MTNTFSQPTKYSSNTIKGSGLGLRSSHYQEIFETKPDVPWFELLTDNYMADGGLPILRAEQIRQDYPVTLHGVGMSLGSTDPLNTDYLSRLKQLIERLEPAYVSDHIAWVSVDGKYTHDLLPLPYTAEALDVISTNINKAQEFLGRRLLVENPSSYLTFTNDEMPEWEFIQHVVNNTDCELLLDINNIYVSSQNHNFDPYHYLSQIPADKVKEIHLAGYEKKDHFLFDTHGYQVRPPVWALYRAALERFGSVPTLIEWDTDVPDFKTLRAEASKAERLMQAVASQTAIEEPV
ncbi:DUF692 domain-containing protein [Litoribrevibacter euphylliae]|uniref:UPF0276 protein ACFOEK_08600 n=1 Tax=Litoribrevibacter euphylliae TaxID=1834034 RepID=A0ABV7HG23_9GAMM